MLNAVGSSSEAVKTTVSGLAVPLAIRKEPFAFTEFEHPWPSTPKLKHGQNVVTFGSIESPAQYPVPEPHPPTMHAATSANDPQSIGPQPVTVSQPAWHVEAEPSGSVPLLPDVMSCQTSARPFML